MAEIALRINGEEHRLAVDTRTTLLDLLREHLGLTGAKKGCDHGQCGACTVLLDGRRANACLALAVAHDGAEVIDGRGPRRRATTCTRCRRPSSSTTRSSAATARPARSARRSGMLAEARGGGRRARRRRDPRAHERQPLPLRRLPEHRRRDRRRRAVRPFAYERAADADAAAVARRAERARRYLAGGTNLVDLMKLGVETPERLVDVTRLPHDAIEDAAGGGLRIGAAVRNSDLAAAPGRARALPAARAGAAGRRVGPAAQPRHRRRQPAAAHALLVLPGRHEAVQQARAGLRLPGARGRAPQPRHPRALRALRRHPPVRHGGRAGRARRDRARPRPRRRARDPDARPAPPARRRARARHGARARRADHRGRAAAADAAARRSAYRKVRDRASYAFAVVSVAAALDAARRRRRATAGSRSAASPTCRGAPSGRGGAARRARRPRRAFAAAADAELAAGASRCATTPSRSPLARNVLVAHARGAVRVTATAAHPAPSARRSAASRAREKVTGQARYAYEHPAEGVAYCRAGQRHDRRGRDRAASTRRGRSRSRACSPSSRTRTRRGSARSTTASCAVPVARGRLPRADRRRGGRRVARGRARGGRRRARRATTRRAHDVVLRADHPRLYAPEKVNPALPDRHRARRPRRRAAPRPRSSSTRPTRRRPIHNNPMEPHATLAALGGRRADALRLEPGRVARARRRSPRLFGPRARAGARDLASTSAAASAPRARRARTSCSPRSPRRSSGARSSSRSPASRCSPIVGYRTPTIQRLRLGADARRPPRGDRPRGDRADLDA